MSFVYLLSQDSRLLGLAPVPVLPEQKPESLDHSTHFSGMPVNQAPLFRLGFLGDTPACINQPEAALQAIGKMQGRHEESPKQA